MPLKRLIPFLITYVLLSACARESVRDMTTFVSRSETEWTEDSTRLEMRGFTWARELHSERGPLPAGIRASYPVYTEEYKYELYEVTTSADATVGDDYAFIALYDESLFGYATDNLSELNEENRGYTYSSEPTDMGERFYYRTHLLHITRVVNGNDVDAWLPLSPFDLRYRCMIFHAEN